MKIIASAKEFLNDHKPELIAFAASAGAIAVVLYVAHNRKNCIEITRELAEELKSGDDVRFMLNGVKYSLAQAEI